MTISKLVTDFLGSQLYMDLWCEGWQLVHESIIRKHYGDTKKPKYIPRGTPGVIFIDQDTLKGG